MHYFVRWNEAKKKPIITPCKTFRRLLELQKQFPNGTIRKNISSGEDVKCGI